MFSPRLFVFAALLVAAAALPAEKPLPVLITELPQSDLDDSTWFRLPLFGDIFSSFWKLFPSFSHIGPKVISDDDKFQIILNVQDFTKDDLSVKVKGDFIFMQGTHETKKDGHDIFASQFFHTYSMPANASAADVTAELSSNGYLIVIAPINGAADKTQESQDRDVPIVESGKPYQTEDNLDNEQVTTEVQSTPASNDERKEPTTPRDEVTENDNVIPHGSEVSP